MRKRALSVLLLMTFATITATVASAQAPNPTEPPEPSPCITDAQMQVVAESGWFAARPSGTEDIYKIYVESFRGTDHLERILAEAQTIVSDGVA